MRIKIIPKGIQGNTKAIASKSDAHRAVICAALADGKTNIHISEMSEDIRATLACMQALGAGISESSGVFTIEPIKGLKKKAVLDCGESGSTLRFLLPVAAALGMNAEFIGGGRLPERPIGIITDLLEEKGIAFDNKKLPINMEGRLIAGEFKIRGDVSSQFISGLLFALPLLDDTCTIRLISPLESRAYIDMTLAVLNKFGANIKETESGYVTEPVKRYVSPGSYTVEGDWSNSAFFLTGAALSGKTAVYGIDTKSKQADIRILDILRKAGADVDIDSGKAVVQKNKLKPFELDVSQCPDLFPIAAVLACGAEGKSVLYNAERLRIKESDRIKSVRALIEGLGGSTVEEQSALTIFGKGGLDGGEVSSVNDHRIAMSACIASCICKNPVILNNAQAVKKSYPDFYRDFEMLGGKVNVI